MTEKQRDILNKEFKVNERYTICRGDYESLPCAMVAWNWSDEKMQELADYIGRELGDSTDKGCENKFDDDEFFNVFEYCAVRMGMEYYEDLSDEEYDKNGKEWLSIE